MVLIRAVGSHDHSNMHPAYINTLMGPYMIFPAQMVDDEAPKCRRRDFCSPRTLFLTAFCPSINVIDSVFGIHRQRSCSYISVHSLHQLCVSTKALCTRAFSIISSLVCGWWKRELEQSSSRYLCTKYKRSQTFWRDLYVAAFSGLQKN